ncbi:MAG: hypothetical protein ACFCVG_03795 [Kineosporiaceae bacterium]
MYALTVDQRGSRRTGDRVPQALAALAREVPHPRLAFERTAGDEFQGLVSSADEVLDAVSTLSRLGGWSIGIGAGEVSQPLPDSTREARGPAFIAAREAVESARRRPRPRLAVRGPDVVTARHAETGLRLLLLVLDARSRPAWEAAELVRRGATHSAAAEALGITRQAVGQRLAAGHLELEQEARPLMEYLLTRAHG